MKKMKESSPRITKAAIPPPLDFNSVPFDFSESFEVEPPQDQPLTEAASSPLMEQTKKVIFIGIRRPLVLRPIPEILQSAAALPFEK
jgi:hypothetical protein